MCTLSKITKNIRFEAALLLVDGEEGYKVHINWENNHERFKANLLKAKEKIPNLEVIFIEGDKNMLKQKILWANAKKGLLGLNYQEWPWYKQKMAHFRIFVYKLWKKTWNKSFSLQPQPN